MSNLVAVTCSSETTKGSRGELRAQYTLNTGLPAALASAGAQAAVLPHARDMAPEDATGILRGMLALIVTGGDFDLPPSYYGEAVHPRLGRTDPLRSHVEATLIRAAQALNLPILGICGGMQLLNVLYGGSLVQDLSLWPNPLAHEQRHDPARPGHAIRVEAKTLLARSLGSYDVLGATFNVNSTHHQIIGRLGEGLRASATASDGVIEAIELAAATAATHDAPYVVGVQWHPELLADERQQGIFQELVAAGRRQTQR